MNVALKPSMMLDQKFDVRFYLVSILFIIFDLNLLILSLKSSKSFLLNALLNDSIGSLCLIFVNFSDGTNPTVNLSYFNRSLLFVIRLLYSF